MINERILKSQGCYLLKIPYMSILLRRIIEMDRTDRKILAELQNDGRQSLTELAGRVGLSLSPCHRRVRALEDAGVITGYRAHLSAPLLGFNFSSLVFVTLCEGHQQAIAEFETAVIEIPYVIQAQRLFGDPDFLLMVVTQDLPAFQRLYDGQLSRLPNVQRLTSTLVMKHVITDRHLPL